MGLHQNSILRKNSFFNFTAHVIKLNSYFWANNRNRKKIYSKRKTQIEKKIRKRKRPSWKKKTFIFNLKTYSNKKRTNVTKLAKVNRRKHHRHRSVGREIRRLRTLKQKMVVLYGFIGVFPSKNIHSVCRRSWRHCQLAAEDGGRRTPSIFTFPLKLLTLLNYGYFGIRTIYWAIC